MRILTLYALPKAQRRQLLAADPSFEFVSRDDYRPEMAPTIDVILGWNRDAAAIIARPNKVGFVQAMSAGVDYLPLQAFVDQGIELANTSGIHAEPIAEYVIGGVLSFYRGLFPVATTWDTRERFHQMGTLRDRHAVIFGTGHIGSRIATHLRQFGVNVLGISRHGNPDPAFDQVATAAAGQAAIAGADIIVNAMPLTAATQAYFDADFFAKLTAKPLFINIGRGATVDQDALITALTTTLRGAVLDVFAQEPLPENSPLWQLPNALITPHVAGQTEHLREQVGEIFAQNLQAYAATGKPAIHRVDLAAGY
ncbi:NAD(P)-dependent oxidoreductase [Lacticaseibacillus sp. GG6-2]